jgi:beta-lactamase class A
MIEKRIIFIAIGMFVAGAVMGWGSLATTQTKTTVPSASLSESLPLLNPSAVAGWDKYFIINFKPLKEKFKEIQSEYPEKTYIYFDYLNSASWVGLNEKELFTAASTIKVPLAMAIYKLVEEGKIRLDEAYTLDELDLDDHFGTLYKIGAGRELTVQTLIEIMLEQSDNTAMQALISVAQKAGLENPFDDVYGAMGWDATNFGEAPRYEEINLKTLSTMFLALYNAKYLDPEHSQMILSYLTTSPFNEKIVAGVPQGIPIAHKMGVAGYNNTFSDCGIIYIPKRPYLLCVGASGLSEARANAFISAISNAAYHYVTTQ